jgi:hypothetical protein
MSFRSGKRANAAREDEDWLASVSLSFQAEALSVRWAA